MPDKTTPNPTDITTPSLEKQESTSQGINKPPPTASSNKPRKPPLQVNIPTRNSTRLTLVTGKTTATTTPGTQQLFVDPSSDEEFLVDMQDQSVFLKRQHEGTPLNQDNTNSPKDKIKNKQSRRSPKKKNPKISYLNNIFPI